MYSWYCTFAHYMTLAPITRIAGRCMTFLNFLMTKFNLPILKLHHIAVPGMKSLRSGIVTTFSKICKVALQVQLRVISIDVVRQSASASTTTTTTEL